MLNNNIKRWEIIKPRKRMIRLRGCNHKNTIIQKEKKGMKKIVKRAGLISGIILSAFVIGGCGKTVDLNDCVEVKVSGIDGKGKARGHS